METKATADPDRAKVSRAIPSTEVMINLQGERKTIRYPLSVQLCNGNLLLIHLGVIILDAYFDKCILLGSENVELYEKVILLY